MNSFIALRKRVVTRGNTWITSVNKEHVAIRDHHYINQCPEGYNFRDTYRTQLEFGTCTIVSGQVR